MTRDLTQPPQQDEMPVVLPRIIIRPLTAETLRMSVNGHDVARVIRRTELGALLSHVIDYAAGPVRVEVHQPDGTVFADILTPHLGPPDMSGGESMTPTIVETAGASGPDTVNTGDLRSITAGQSSLLRGEWGPTITIDAVPPVTTADLP